ncbi:transcription termination factor Rho [Butyrivibrio sp. ob235]|uniref:transcription termination factor Rho n=1 Tax=Butyrivibrio sp. ob235 TaxID=1761780 RepID=UPI0008AE1462|nr:transcription termination factor Rho [Butyrivibrio sp. ob235]SEK40325.1 transcription termination factor Rho [Butyrivibrio sp. ob235]
MREKLETLTLASLRDLAKQNGIKSVTTMKKSELIDALLELYEKQQAEEAKAKAAEAKEAETKGSEKKPAKSANESNDKPAQKKPGKKKVIIADNSRNDGADKKPAEKKAPDKNSNEAKPAENKEQKSSSESQESYAKKETPADEAEIANGIEADGILEVMQDGFGFIRCENYLPGENDVYVAPGMIRKYNLKTGDILKGIARQKKENDKFGALLQLNSINGYKPEVAMGRWDFEKMTPIFPNQQIVLEHPGCTIAMRIMDMISPIGKGQRGMIVSPPKAGKTTLLKDVALSVKRSNPDIHLIVLLIDERPEEVTDIKESIEGPNAEVIYSTFDELPEHHKRVSEMVIERAKRLVEHNKDVMILLDSITRLTRAYNIVVPPSGRTLSGGLDPAALHMPKRFFGAARNMRQGGSLTILATALVETGSKMDDVIYEEFKGTGNMEMVLDRKMQEKRIFPAINIPKSSTRREDLLLKPEELAAVNALRKGFNGMKADEAVDQCINMFSKTRTNQEFVRLVEKQISRY